MSLLLMHPIHEIGLDNLRAEGSKQKGTHRKVISIKNECSVSLEQSSPVAMYYTFCTSVTICLCSYSTFCPSLTISPVAVVPYVLV